MVGLTCRPVPSRKQSPVFTAHWAVRAPQQVWALLRKKITRPAEIRTPYRPARGLVTAVNTGVYVFENHWTESPLGKITELATMQKGAAVTQFKTPPQRLPWLSKTTQNVSQDSRRHTRNTNPALPLDHTCCGRGAPWARRVLSTLNSSYV